ncbi:MAG: phosphoglycerate mutase family protein [Actinomycetota bacterium]
MTLFLVRHAVAGVRNNHDPRDDQRPLDEVGRRQAELIAEALGSEPIDEICTSAALRCRQTVEPLGSAIGVSVDDAPELFEGTSSSRAIEFVRSFTGRTAVLCSHGDVIPDVLRSLEIGGTRLEGRGCAKGSIWRLDNSSERIETGVYLGPIEAVE